MSESPPGVAPDELPWTSLLRMCSRRHSAADGERPSAVARDVELAHHTASGSRRPHTLTSALWDIVVRFTYRSFTARPSSSISRTRYARRTRSLPRGASPLPWRPYTYYIHAPCTACTYGLHVPASSVPYVPEAHMAACPVRGMHYCMYATSFGRAVRMHTRGTPGGLRRVAPPRRRPSFGGPPFVGLARVQPSSSP